MARGADVRHGLAAPEGQKPGTGWVTKPNGTREIAHAQRNEWYANAAGDRLHIVGLFRIKINAEGVVTRDQWGYRANCISG